MKTNIYNKEEHIEGYIGSGKEAGQKSAIQKEYEKGNDTNEVMSFGKDTVAETNLKKSTEGNAIKAKDGLDNTGTQGKDSLSDDAYNTNDKNPTVKSAESGTGSASKDFKKTHKTEVPQRNEDDVLDTGI